MHTYTQWANKDETVDRIERKSLHWRATQRNTENERNKNKQTNRKKIQSKNRYDILTVMHIVRSSF